MGKLRIMLADDHALVREGLKQLIDGEPDMEVVGEAGDGLQACQQVAALRPDVLVLDLSMPGLSGLQATEQLRQAGTPVKVLVLSMHEEEGYLRQLLRAGASGYVLKRAAAGELTRAVRTVAAGGMYIDPMLAGKFVDLYVDHPATGRRPAGHELSARETEVLRLLAWGYINKEIAQKLNISIKTVETYKARLMAKLELRSRVDIVRYALRQGWLRE